MINSIEKNGIAFVGDLTIDKYSELGKIHLGGASLNSAVWAIRAGADHVSVFAAVGTDTVGKEYFEVMRNEHVDESHVQVLPGNTSSIEVNIDPRTKERSWGVWDGGVLERYHLGSHELDLLRLSQAASLTIYGKTAHLLPELADWGKYTKERPILAVNFDDLSQFDHSPKIVIAHALGFDMGFFGLDRDTDAPLIQEIEHLARDTGKLMIVTLNEHGAIAFDKHRNYVSPEEPVPNSLIKDRTGAGDAFLAAFIVTYLKTSGDIRASLVAGNHFGAKKIQILGAY